MLSSKINFTGGLNEFNTKLQDYEVNRGLVNEEKLERLPQFKDPTNGSNNINKGDFFILSENGEKPALFQFLRQETGEGKKGLRISCRVLAWNDEVSGVYTTINVPNKPIIDLSTTEEYLSKFAAKDPKLLNSFNQMMTKGLSGLLRRL